MFKIICVSTFTVSICFFQSSFAGCLEPEKPLYEGPFIVESCVYKTVTNVVYDDPRLLENSKGESPYKKPTDFIAMDTKSGKPRILKLTPENRGVLLAGSASNKGKVISAFLRTKDSAFCEKLVKSIKMEVSIVEACCDCFNSCVDSPCANGTKNEIKKYKSIPDSK
jgi:hypothetical protein